MNKLRKMELKSEIIKSIEKSVLCWVATVSNKGVPNVSPKECFTYYGKESIIFANIASPQTVRNIEQNENTCVSFIDILVQKGFQVKGKAEIIKENDSEFASMYKILNEMTKGKFPFKTITRITIEKVKPIIAPSYILFPKTTEDQQIENSKKSYGI